jgi:hypothetical protein
VGTTGVTASGKQILGELLVGLCFGAIAAALVWHFYPGFWNEPPASLAIAIEPGQAPLAGTRRPAEQPVVALVRPQSAPVACDFEPLIPPNGGADGHASIEHPFPAGPRARAKVFLRAADAAAAQGRARDVEVALLAACRASDAASDRPTLPFARVLGLLGERYAAAAARTESQVLQEQLVSRARHVLALSAKTYDSALGPNAATSRRAWQRVTELEQDVLAASDLPASSDLLPRVRLAPAPQPQRVQATPAATAATIATARARPQPAQRLPRPEPPQQRPAPGSDPEIMQLAADLARLRAQAESVSDDRAGFRQRAAAAQAERAQCADAACLRRWYAKRRRELLAEF